MTTLPSPCGRSGSLVGPARRGPAGHQPGALRQADLAFRDVAGPAAAGEEEAAADRVRVVRVVGEEDHVDAAVAGPGDGTQRDAGLLDAERGRWRPTGPRRRRERAAPS